LSDDSKTQILKVATRLFARRGYDGTSLQSIADEVGMRKPSLLYHFPSKEALRSAVLSKLVERWETRFPEVLAAAQGAEDRFDAMFTEAAEFFRRDPNRARLILREMVDRPHATRELLGAAVAPWLQLVIHTLEDGKVHGRVRPDVDPLAYIMECIALIIGTFAAADLATGLMGSDSPEASIERQFREVLRIARTSLFTEQTLHASGGDDRTTQARA
jgi:AcrR family transcriptional regulator